MRVAVIGAGRMGTAHVRTLASLGVVDDLLVADVDESRADAVARDHAAEATTIDGAFAAQPDGIVVVAPTSEHAGLIRRGIAAGIAVFCEKPVAPTLTETLAIVAEVDAHDVPVQIGFQRRFDPGYRAARQALESGELGELRRAHLVTCDPAPPPAEFIPTSGGLFRDCNIHDYDILRWVTGQEAVSVYAVGANRGASFFAEAGDVDEAASIVTLADGTIATVHGSRYNGAGYDVRMEVAGTRGQRSVGLDERAPLRSAEDGIAFPQGAAWPNFAERFAVAYAAELAAFVRVAAGEQESPCTPREALHALLIAEAADRSRRTGQVIQMRDITP